MIKYYIDDIVKALKELDDTNIFMAVKLISDAKKSGKYIYTFGNGGSGATASHLAGDLSKGCHCKAFCLNDSNPALTALANDLNYEYVFSKRLEDIVSKDDVVIAISGSGNSPNVVNGVIMANSLGAKTIGLTAFDGGKLKSLVTYPIVAQVVNMEQAEDIHMIICHIIKTCLGMKNG